MFETYICIYIYDMHILSCGKVTSQRKVVCITTNQPDTELILNVTLTLTLLLSSTK